METLNEELDPNAVITCDAGNFATWLHNQLVIKDSHLFLGPTNGAMGYGIPSAIGAKIAEPHRTVVSFNGDGGGMMTIQEIETSVRHKAPIIILLFDNQNYGTIRMHQEMYYPDKVIGTALGEVDFAKVAEGMGAIGMEVKSKDEFLPAFQKALQQDRTVLIDIKCFEENYVANRKTYEDVKGSKV
ncbi:thiamine pyrophosphate-dependent enzyme [Geomicrobium sp. JCM 19037]|uniref:thiamine pyrophosphate-dependent enzyme n=2 Tax=unclassified Geomicrobium TaxID=2628951 RepID=UPI001EE68054|nr:thiamine pyrophosphate-dependent enzyme [Geomicrobium sp. JCM 19037]